MEEKQMEYVDYFSDLELRDVVSKLQIKMRQMKTNQNERLIELDIKRQALEKELNQKGRKYEQDKKIVLLNGNDAQKAQKLAELKVLERTILSVCNAMLKISGEMITIKELVKFMDELAISAREHGIEN
jgi:hypothetical protein